VWGLGVGLWWSNFIYHKIEGSDLAKFGYKQNMKVKKVQVLLYSFGYLLESRTKSGYFKVF